MKSLLLFLFSVSLSLAAVSQDVYLDSHTMMSFFSSTPVEDISAKSEQGVGAINVKTKDVFFKVPMKTFVFKKALMQEHFNENYVESEKFPYSTFKGVINEDIDFTKDGTYKVTVTGALTVHGVAQNRTIPGVIVIKDKSIDVTCDFDVKVAEHDIDIPTLVVTNIAEVIAVKIHGVLEPAKK